MGQMAQPTRQSDDSLQGTPNVLRNWKMVIAQRLMQQRLLESLVSDESQASIEVIL